MWPTWVVHKDRKQLKSSPEAGSRREAGRKWTKSRQEVSRKQTGSEQEEDRKWAGSGQVVGRKQAGWSGSFSQLKPCSLLLASSPGPISRVSQEITG